MPQTLPESLSLEVRGVVAVLTLDRARKRNALDTETVLGLERFFTAVPEGVRAVVLHGDGDHFCAGLDLSDLSDAGVEAGLHHSRMWHRVMGTIQLGTVPVVSALTGAVIGGGLELASATHIRVAEPSAFYALPEGQRGLFLGGGGSVRLPRLIGVARMTDMMLTGRVYDAAEGQAAGLSHYLVGDGAGLAKGLELARKVAANAPLSNYAITQALPRIAEMAPAEGLFVESLMSAIAQGDEAAKQRVRDFLGKRAGMVGKAS